MLTTIPVIAACDPSYTLYTHARVTENRAPAPGVWVIPVGRDQGDPARTDAEGRAEIRQIGFLHIPRADAFALSRGGAIQSIAIVDRDLPLRNRGIFSRFTYDADLELVVGAAPREFPMRCNATQCEPAQPVTMDACSLSLVSSNGTQAIVAPITMWKGMPYGGVDLEHVPHGMQHVVVAICRDASGRLEAAASRPLQP
jgi:hypothetical protein